MQSIRPRAFHVFVISIACLLLGICPLHAASLSEGHVLQKTYTALEAQLQSSPLKRPALIASAESVDAVSGDLHAVMEQSLEALKSMATNPRRWCEVILLLSNTKACQVEGGSLEPKLSVLASSSKGQSAAGATTSLFQLSVPTDTPEYLNVMMLADSGPMGTRQLRLQLGAIALTPARSFLHLHYSYNTSWMGHMAMQTYLQTLGRGKTGFTAVDSAESASTFIGGARGVIERNTMRYFLGLECSLATHGPESAARFQAMASCWYDEVERYPQQLHEMSRSDYLGMKAAEYKASKVEPK